MTRELMSTILVATDFSEGADRALDRALLLPAAPRCRLHLVHVAPAGCTPAQRDAAMQAMDVRVERARAAMDGETCGGAGGAGRTVSAAIVEGDAYVEIIRRSRHLDADLIVVGRHSKRPSRELTLVGSTARKVLRKGDVPVLVVSLPATHPYERPLVATDLSDVSRRVFDLALQVGGPQVEEIAVVHAVHVPFEHFVTPTAAGAQRSRLRREVEQRAHEALDELLAGYRDRAVRWQPILEYGEARSVIINEAVRRDADLLVMGTHGRTGLSHLLIGSVAEWVLENAACDVLVSHPVRYAFEPSYVTHRGSVHR
jgi:nucleotide-binding universal stress UspA family protein